jgi:hypothetical protein
LQVRDWYSDCRQEYVGPFWAQWSVAVCQQQGFCSGVGVLLPKHSVLLPRDSGAAPSVLASFIVMHVL